MSMRSASGITRAALAAALLFLLTTVMAAVWGGMQYLALRASDVEREALEQRLVALRQEASRMQPAAAPPAPVDPPITAQPPPPLPPDSENMAEMIDESAADTGNTTAFKIPPHEVKLAVESRFGPFLAELSPVQQSFVWPHLASFLEKCAVMTETYMSPEGNMQGTREGHLVFMLGGGARLEQELRAELVRALPAREMAHYDDLQHAEAIMVVKGRFHTFTSDHMDPETLAMVKNMMAEELIAEKARSMKLPPRHIGPYSVLTVDHEEMSETFRKARIQLGRMLSSDNLRVFDSCVEEYWTSLRPSSAD